MFDLQIKARLGGPAGDQLQLVLTDRALRAIVLGLCGPGGDVPIFTDAEIRGFKNPIVFSQSTLIGDLVQSTFPGYAAQTALVWHTPGLDTEGTHVGYADFPAPWVVSGDPAGELLAGIYLLNPDDGNSLIGGVSLDPPVELIEGRLIPGTLVCQAGNP